MVWGQVPRSPLTCESCWPRSTSPRPASRTASSELKTGGRTRLTSVNVLYQADQHILIQLTLCWINNYDFAFFDNYCRLSFLLSLSLSFFLYVFVCQSFFLSPSLCLSLTQFFCLQVCFGDKITQYHVVNEKPSGVIMTLGTFNPLRNLVIITKEKTELHLNEQLNII